MWYITVIISLIVAIVAFIIGRKTCKPKEIEIITTKYPDDYNDYLLWKKSKDDVIVVESDVLYDTIVNAINEAFSKKEEKPTAKTTVKAKRKKIQ